MDVITTHINADFDCLGAMVAARKIYPDALLVFPGAQEKSVRDFFQSYPDYALPITRLKEIDLEAVTRLIIVDCQHATRIGRFADILNKDTVRVILFDHHPESSGSISADEGSVKPCGATTTLLGKLLKQRGVTISPHEATMMMLGIHEDTGSFRFHSTTPDDLIVAAWLLEQGALLSVISDVVAQGMTAAQVSLLHDLLSSLRILTVNGIEVAIADASLDTYIADCAMLSHMICNMKNISVLFLVIAMGDRVHLIARSSNADVNVGTIAEDLGGGGHSFASSATIKNQTVIQVLPVLEASLRQRVTAQRMTRDIMSSPVKTLSTDISLADAKELLLRYNINTMPVMRDGSMVGLISRRIVERAIYHGLSGAPVSDYMHTEFMKAAPDTPIAEIRSYIVQHNRRFVPVFNGDLLVGAVTRTDILRAQQLDAETLVAPSMHSMRGRSIDGILRKSLPPGMINLLHQLGMTADARGVSVYAVGGFVRDLLLGAPNKDVDITVEGDGIAFAQDFATSHAARIRSHEKFHTAVIVLPDGQTIDVASTRLEYYESPGALPVVEYSSLKMDLLRRDFTINTLAVCLNESRFGEMIDFFGAQRDMEDRVIRVLHNLSFVEDPTRVFRAIRFEQRLGFHLALHTENLIKNAIKMNFLDAIGGKRLLNELILLLDEKEPMKALDRLNSFGLLRFIHPDILFDEQLKKLCSSGEDAVTWYNLSFLQHSMRVWLVHFLIVTHKLSAENFMETCKRLALNEHLAKKLLHGREEVKSQLRHFWIRPVAEPILQSDIYHALHTLPDEVVLYLMAITDKPSVRQAVSIYFTRLRLVHSLVDGNDIRSRGVPPGPLYAKLIKSLLDARLNDEVRSREEELALLTELITHETSIATSLFRAESLNQKPPNSLTLKSE